MSEQLLNEKDTADTTNNSVERLFTGEHISRVENKWSTLTRGVISLHCILLTLDLQPAPAV